MGAWRTHAPAARPPFDTTVNTIYELPMVHASPTPTTRERRHEQNLQRILDTAMRMVENGGLEALSINKLADAVDYTPGALYRYVGSKDALLARLVERILGDIAAHMTRMRAGLPDRVSPLAHVFAMVHGYRTFAAAEPQRFGLLAMTMAVPRVLLEQDEDAAPVAAMMTATLSPLAEMLDAAARAEQLSAGDASERAVCLFAFLQGVLQLHKQTRYAPAVLDLDRLALRGTRSLLLGWGASARSVDAAAAHLATLAAPHKTRSGGLR